MVVCLLSRLYDCVFFFEIIIYMCGTRFYVFV